MPDTIKYIREKAFEDCHYLESVRLSKNISWILDFAFNNCSNLKDITLPDNLRVLYEDTFNNCTSLEKIIIPENLYSIWGENFINCINLTVYCEAAVKPVGWDDDWLGDRPVVWGYRAFTITFDSKGGNYISPLTTDNRTATTLPTTEKEGFVFEGWYLDEGYVEPFDPATLIDNTTLPKALKLYAKWSKAF
jgi:uncharacterized repeat protein (TIGR02543 family)